MIPAEVWFDKIYLDLADTGVVFLGDLPGSGRPAVVHLEDLPGSGRYRCGISGGLTWFWLTQMWHLEDLPGYGRQN
jgi:hypothetical protein